VPNWSEGYFDIDPSGRVLVRPLADEGPSFALLDVVKEARARGLRIPLLLRFPDVLRHKLKRLQGAFADAMKAHGYSGGYSAIFPIKVNQQRSVVQEFAQVFDEGFGLEAGSKPELIAVLAMSPGGLVICNGYKDREYIRLALMGVKLGLKVFIVIEKVNELELVIEEARRLDVLPFLGVRIRLAAVGAGKWQNTGGDKGKFGLLPGQVIKLCQDLEQAGLKQSLRLVHCHMGSQMSNVRDIAAGMRELTRYVVELSQAGFDIGYVDVGGGLAVDYEGTRSRSSCSMAYGLEQYANAIITPLAEACAEHGLHPPRVLSESGRAMTAHHAVLVANVTAVEQGAEGRFSAAETPRHPVLRHLHELCAQLDSRPAFEIYHEAQYHLQEGQALFAMGHLNLAERAQLDDIYYAAMRGAAARLRGDVRTQRELKEEIEDKLCDKYFVNFSVFQSVPDVWALEQIFPIMPLDRHLEEPVRRAVLEDLTCDSDGRIDRFVDSGGLENSIPLHPLKDGEDYLLGLFLVGAYQETLGDMHNLFGDTDSLNVHVRGNEMSLSAFKEGDATDELLKYVGYDIDELRMGFRAKLNRAKLGAELAKQFADAFESGLQGYTYLA
jgi:arginine decarboxylase